jgi:fibronectin type 3 domain-containing protein
VRSITPTSGAVAITINAVTGATSYNLYRSTTAGGEGSTPFVSGLSTTSYTDTTVINGTKYYYQATAVNASGESAKSPEYNTIPLAQPSVTIKAGNGAVTLSWGSVTAATSYNVYRSTATGTETLLTSAGNALSYTDTSVSNGTAYFYKVTAAIPNISDESAKSSEVSASPLATLPAAPVLAATPGSSTIALSWNSVGGASSYNVKRATTAGGPYTTISSATSTAFTDTPPLTTATYYYVVTTVAGATESANSNQIAASCTGGITQSPTADAYTLSSQPTRNLGSGYYVAVSGSSTASEESFLTFPVSAGGAIASAQLKIYKLNGAADTETVYGISPGSWTELGVTWNNQPSLVGATTVGTLSVTTANQYYTVDVTSYVQQQIAAGATSVSFAITSSATGQIPYLAREYGSNGPQLVLNVTASTVATGLTATPGEQQVLLTWQPVQGASGYNVYRSTTSGGTYTKITTSAPSAANAYVDGGRTNGTTYYYYVKAIVGGAEGAASALASAAPLAQDANWVITPPSTVTMPDPAIGTNTVGVTSSEGTSLLASANAFGSVTSTVSSQTSAHYSGTWTFTWKGTSWPTLYVIQRLQKSVYSASVDGGTGSATVSNTGGATIVSAAFPIIGSAVTQLPATVVTFNTSDLSLPVLASATTSHVSGAEPAPGATTGADAGWVDTIFGLTITKTAYTGQYFQAHFTTPQAITFSLTTVPADVTVSASLSNTTSSAGNSMATASVSDVYSGT